MRFKSYMLFLFILSMIVVPFIPFKGADELSYAFINVHLVPMSSEVVLDRQTVMIMGSEITTIGPSDQIRIPKNTTIINGEGYYLIPGLADMHMHTREDWEEADIWPVHPLNLYLANGVTTIRDFAPTGSTLTYALDWEKEIEAGLRDGPRIFTSGKLLYASPLEDPAGIVRMNADLGFDFIKFYSYLSEDDFLQGIQEARILGIYTAGHIPFAVGLEGVLESGMDEIAHVEELIFEFFDFNRQQVLTPDEWWDVVKAGAVKSIEIEKEDYLDRFFRANASGLESISSKLLAADIPVDSTMIVDRVVVQKNFQRESFLDKPENMYFKNGYLENYMAGDEKHLNQCRGVEVFCAAKEEIDGWIFRGLKEAGVLLVLGTDAGTGGMGIVPGYSVHEELAILVENGMTPYQALQCATTNAGIVAEKMTGEGDFGTIEVGNRADLILVDSNPLEDLSVLRTPAGVMAAGRWYEREILQKMIEIE